MRGPIVLTLAVAWWCRRQTKMFFVEMDESSGRAPITVRVGCDIHVTCRRTMARYENSLLAACFRLPSPIFDEFAQQYVMPQELVSADAFAVILDHLRTGEWLPIRSPELFDSVEKSCLLLGLPSKPLGRPTAWEPSQFVHCFLDLPKPSESGVFPLPSTVMELGRKGFEVVSQTLREDQDEPKLQSWPALQDASSKPSGPNLRAVFARRVPELRHIRRLLTVCEDPNPPSWLNAIATRKLA